MLRSYWLCAYSLAFQSFIWYSALASNEFSSIFEVTLDCNSKPGCASDDPSWVSPARWERIGSKDSQFCPMGEAVCAFLCRENVSCVGFNYLGDLKLCQFFTSRVFMISSRAFCANFQMPPIVKADQNLTNVNLALGKRTCRSSTMKFHDSWLAVNGKVKNDLIGGDCSYDTGDKVFNWLMIDLEVAIVLDRVRIFIVDLYIERYKNLKVGLTNASWLERFPVKDAFLLCGINQPNSPISSWITVYCSKDGPSGRFLIIQQSNLNKSSAGYMPLCQVEAYAV